MRMKHKSWSEPYLTSHPEVVLTVVKEDDVHLEKDQTYVLEIGTGRGDFILQMAIKHPEYQFIGIEMNVDALAITAKKIVESGVKNVHLIRQNFFVIAPFFLENSFSKIYLNFSDPWPKKRHAKRRLTSPSFLKEYARLLKKDGALIFKTDNYDLFTYSLETLKEEQWKILLLEEPYMTVEDDDAMTEYEKKFRDLGMPIYRLVAQKEENL